MSYLDKIKKEDFKDLLLLAKKEKSDIDVERLYKEFLGGNKNLDGLLSRWLKSIKLGKPDFSVYGEDDYLNEVFFCWKNFSRRYLRTLKKFFEKNEDFYYNVESILDMGCGIGYTTIALSEMFVDAIIYGQNLKGTLQHKINKRIAAGVKNVKIVDERDFLNRIKSVDLIFASEYFEHLLKPIDMLQDLINKFHPRYFIFANSFTHPESIGHFYFYEYNGKQYSGKEISRLFYKVLSNNGYKRVDTGFFNGRPCVYELKENKNV